MQPSFILAIAVTLVMRFHLIITRYIDPDEFAHLHWAWLLTQGFRPYRDFFINFVPVYQLFLAPVTLLPPASTTVIVGRIWEGILYVGLVALTYRIGRSISGNAHVGRWAALLFIVFPMTFDKTLELRPDTLMTILSMGAITVLLGENVLSSRRAFWSGLLFGTSLATLLKIIVAAPAVFYLLLTKKLGRKVGAAFIGGLLIPVGTVFLALGALGLDGLAYKNIILGSAVLKQGEGVFSGWLSFSPWPLVYVTGGGVSLPWLVNVAIWLASAFGLWILWQRHRQHFVFVVLFLSCALLFLFLFPTPYLQYFIPLSVFISVLAAITIHTIGKPPLLGLVLLLLLLSFAQQYQDRIHNTNEEQRKVIDDVLRVTRPDETMYDMVGSYVFRPDGYYICCNVYSQFADQLGLGIPTLPDAIRASQMKFFVLDRAGKSLWLPKPEDLQSLQTNYLPSAYPKIYSLGIAFGCRNGACIQYRLDDKPAANRSTTTFTILVPETYLITIKPNGEMVTIDDKEIKSGQTLDLAAGLHRFSASSRINSLRIQLDR